MKTIVAIGDTHAGDSFSICPERFETSVQGAVHRPNKGQKYLLKCHKDVLGRIPERYDALIVNGDIIQGTKEARWLWEPDATFQARAGVEIIRPFAQRADRTYLTQGTTWHSGEGSDAEEKVGESLDADDNIQVVKWGSHYCYPFLRLDMDGVRIDIAHHLSYMSRYMASALEREIQFAAMIHEWGGEPDLIIRSHVHHWFYLNAEGRIGVILPSWQLQNIYSQTSTMPTRHFPKWLGAVQINIYPEKKHKPPQNAGEFIEVIPYLYQHPKLLSERIG
jgi:hypothetical protein